MKKLVTYIGTGVAAVAMLIAFAGNAQAWHPVGKVKKEVQNVTQSSALKDANSAQDAVTVKPGDTIKYVVTVHNNGQYHKKGHNDMHYTKVTDSLPAGVTLLSGNANANLGHIKAGESKRYEFTAKVTSTKNGDVICNTANFTGDSEVYDQPQKGSDKACIKVVVPEPKMIKVCYIGKGPQMHTIKESEFDRKTMSKNPADCKVPEKMIKVCYINKGTQLHTIKESQFDAKTMSRDVKDCKKPETPKPVDKKIEVCIVEDKKIEVIKESEFDEKTMSRDKKDCDTPEPAPAPAPQPTKAVAELPKTGLADVVGGLIGIGSVTAASVAYLRSRR